MLHKRKPPPACGGRGVTGFPPGLPSVAAAPHALQILPAGDSKAMPGDDEREEVGILGKLGTETSLTGVRP